MILMNSIRKTLQGPLLRKCENVEICEDVESCEETLFHAETP